MRAYLSFACSVLTFTIFAQEKPRPEIVASYLFQDKHPFTLQEIGASVPAKLEDTIKVKLTVASTKETGDDSRWIIHSADSVGSEIKSKREGNAVLKTAGHYVFVSYSVENLRKTSVRVFGFGLMDDKGRKFSPLEFQIAWKYLPADYENQEPNLNAGLKRKFCSIYELPAGAKPVTVLLVPLGVPAFQRHNMETSFFGKKVNLGGADNDASGLGTKPDNASKTTAAQTFILTMKCTRTENVEEKIRRAVSVRSLGYTVDLKVLNVPEKEVQVKAFFIGESVAKRLMISEIVEKQVTVGGAKAASITVACRPVTENDRQNDGLELKGVIIQAWVEGKLMQSYTSQFAWKKYAELPDVLTQFELYKPRKNYPGFKQK